MSIPNECKNLLHNFIESLPHGVMIVTQEGVIEDVNRNFSFVFNMSSVTPGKTSYREVLTPKSATFIDAIVSEVKAAGFVLGKDAMMSIGTETEVSVAVSASFFFDETNLNKDILIFCKEMSARQEIERMKDLEKMKTEFISSITHDLKAPLTSVVGYADLLLEMAKPKLDNDELEYITIIKQEGLRLTRMINDILNVAKIDSGALQLKPELIAIKEIVDEVYKVASVQGKNFKFVIEVKEDVPSLWLDKDLITRVIMNLTSNAIKYSPQGGVIAIRVFMDAGNVLIDVTDSGMGMSEESLSHLFEKFFRVKNDSTKGIAGTGLGLVITRGFVEAHGGALKVKSKLGEGSTFSVVLPGRLATHKP